MQLPAIRIPEWVEERSEVVFGTVLLPVLFVAIPHVAGQSWQQTFESGELLILSASICSASLAQFVFRWGPTDRNLSVKLHMCGVIFLLALAIIKFAVRVKDTGIEKLGSVGVSNSKWVFLFAIVAVLVQPVPRRLKARAGEHRHDQAVEGNQDIVDYFEEVTP